MIQGKVKSLVFISKEKQLKVGDIWVIAVLSHLYFKTKHIVLTYKGVKEQRVDGSSKSRILDFVRCTLVAGKPVFGRKIHSHSYNSKTLNDIFKRSIHTTKYALDP